jgi:hypothetical protein
MSPYPVSSRTRRKRVRDFTSAIAADVVERIAASVWTRLRPVVVHEHRKTPLSPGGEFAMTRPQGLVAGFSYS